ncbi:hypothetical protein V7798_15795 [Rhizobium laguerreae]
MAGLHRRRHRLGSNSFVATLSFPSLVNNLFLNVARGGRVKTANYRAWEKAADAVEPAGIVKLQGDVLPFTPDRRDVTWPTSKCFLRYTYPLGCAGRRQRGFRYPASLGSTDEVSVGECRVELVDAASAKIL